MFALVALAGAVTIAAGVAGIVGDEKNGRAPSDSYTVLKAGVGITVGSGALSGILFGVAYRKFGRTHVGLAPRFGPGFGGGAVTLWF